MKTVIFDMYGVIIKDPGGNLVPFVNRTFPELKTEDVYIHWMDGNIGSRPSSEFFKNIGYKGDLAEIEAEYLNSIEIDGAFIETALTLRRYYRLALLSNDLSEWSDFLRRKFELNSLFDAIIVSGDVKIKKPDPLIFRMMLDRLAQPASECIYVDDRRSNLTAARSLGMDTILFNSRNVSFDGKIVNNFHELAEMLL